MPGDHFFGEVGVDSYYGGGLGINNPFSEPEWNPSNIVSIQGEIYIYIYSIGQLWEEY